ncbi:MAG: hypothetical protein FJ272_08795 [Planctomycetes bacterium]|nr:hypothetical protein [Planctomycetota bacterium]
MESKGELFKSDATFPGYHELKVVCAGPLLHAFVDGAHVFSHTIPPGEGRIGLYSHGGGEAFYDDLRIETRVAPEYYVLTEPTAPNDALVFSPGDDVKLQFKVRNHSAAPQQVTVAASVKTWGDVAVKGPLSQTVTVRAQAEQTLEFRMGQIPAGFYKVDVQAHLGDKPISRAADLPLAVQPPGAGEFKAPKIPVAAYYKYTNKTSPIYLNTYAHAAARSLRDHHFNAVVADPSFTEQTITVFQSYGLATIARGSFLDHPGVIATLAHDEPKPDEVEKLKESYRKLQETTDKPITTCMVGESMGLGVPGDPVLLWQQLKPQLRAFRWYGVKKSFYGPLHECQYKGWLPLSSVLRIAEACSDTPYWFVVPSLGKTDHEAYYFRPSPADTKCMMHLALAYGADGLLFWAFQSHLNWPCFVDQASLAPLDGNYAAAADVAAKISPHADLLAALRVGGLDVRCTSPVVDARPMRDSRDQKVYVYVVNKDTRSPVSTRLLLWAERWALAAVRDVYSGKALEVRPPDEEGYLSVPLPLEPGEGQLLALEVTDRQAPPAAAR